MSTSNASGLKSAPRSLCFVFLLAFLSNLSKLRSGLKPVSFDTILYEEDGPIGTITLNRPDDGNMFTPEMCHEIRDCINDIRRETRTRVIVITGAGDRFFCIGGRKEGMEDSALYAGMLPTLDMYESIDKLQKPVIASVAGYAIGGGHVLHVICDLSIAADNARFGQTGPKVGSFDGGLGASYLSRIVGQKKAREIWYLCRQYDAQQALDMGLVNTVVPLAELEEETLKWAREILQHSPMALRCLKAALNADCDGQQGLLDMAGNATLLYYMTEEAKEGRNAFIEKREPDFSKFPRYP